MLHEKNDILVLILLLLLLLPLLLCTFDYVSIGELFERSGGGEEIEEPNGTFYINDENTTKLAICYCKNANLSLKFVASKHGEKISRVYVEIWRNDSKISTITLSKANSTWTGSCKLQNCGTYMLKGYFTWPGSDQPVEKMKITVSYSSQDGGVSKIITLNIGKCNMCFDNLTRDPIFEIYGVTKTPYLRVLVGEVYRDGVWGILNTSSPIRYDGRLLEQEVTVDKSHIQIIIPLNIQIIPLIVMEGFIPSASNSLRIDLLKNKCDLWYYPDQHIFYSSDGVHGDYIVTYANYVFDEKILTSASMPNDSRYLDVPQNMFPTLKSLANKIVEMYGAKSPYEKLKAIEDFLRNNYVYDKNYTSPPSGYDPILWFLFNEKRGVCIHFNSAFVLLARTLGLPTRLVGGYLVDPEEYYQAVYKDQAHAYAEALFENLGWIIFDATPPGSGGKGKKVDITCTITNITHVDDIGVKGLTFRVLGQVLDEYGSGVSGLPVKVYLRHDKKSIYGTIPIGEGIVENGFFNITCYVPLNVNVGDYFVIAHTITKGKYLGSWSDPPIKIMAKTYFLVNCPEKVIASRSFRVSGFLREVDSNLPIINENITLICGQKVYWASTDKNGNFTIICSIMEPGNYTLTLRFNGSKYYLSSLCEKPLKVLSLEITPLTRTPLIRGEYVNFSGIVHAENIACDNEVVAIYFDGVEVARTKTDFNGYFNIIYHIPKNHTLGKSVIKYFLQSNGFNVSQEVNVMARTQIIVSAPEKPIESGKLFNITATLLNDFKEPIPSAQILLKYSYQDNDISKNSTTNERGVALFNTSLSVSKEEDVKYLLVFPGNELYLGTDISGYVKVIPTSKSFTYQFYLILMAIMLGTSFSTYFLHRRGWFKRKTTPEEGAKAREEKPLAPVVAKKNVNLTIKFPEIREPFPLVWGINEKLAVRLEVNGNGAPVNDVVLMLSVDEGGSIYLKSSPNGDVKTYLTFTEKGVHKLKAYFAGNDEWNEAVAETSIRIVDYREEIIDLFNSYLKSALARYQGLNETMTAREIQYRLLNQISESKYGYLEDLISIFEVANYSLHLITRREYEKMFLAKLNLEV